MQVQGGWYSIYKFKNVFLIIQITFYEKDKHVMLLLKCWNFSVDLLRETQYYGASSTGGCL